MHAPESSESSSTGLTRTKRKFRPAGYVVSGSNMNKNKPEMESGNWKVVTEPELEALLVKSIEESLREALKKLVAMGYNPEEVCEAIMSCGYKAFPGLVECAILNCVKHASNPAAVVPGDDSSSSSSSSTSSSSCSSTLDVRLLVNEMLSAVRDDRPSLSRADAIWCLLMADLDVREACKVESSSLEVQLSPGSSSEAQVSQRSTSETQVLQGSTSKTQGSSSETQVLQGSSEDQGEKPSSACTELSLSLVSEAKNTSESSKRKLVEAGEADERIKHLNEEVRGLRIEVQERAEWARSKVLQAAQRLSKDVGELRKLRAEKQEASRLEESSLKRFSDLENALRKTGTQLDQTRTALQKLEMSNAEIRAELEAAKLSAAESVASCLQASKIEKKTVKKAQSWEKQRAKLQEELAGERKKVAEAQQQLSQMREKQLQTEVRSRQETKAREEAISRMEAEKLAREQAEYSARIRVESIESKSESDLRFYRDEIQKLEQEVSRLKSGSNDQTLGAPPAPFSLWASTGFIAPALERHQSFESSSSSPGASPPGALEWPEFTIRRDRECVMCLNEEMSVVFLPCAHQVVCIKCNDLHQKQGMNECPSCRTRIQQRIRVYGATSS